jgi:hypothetical protein
MPSSTGSPVQCIHIGAIYRGPFAHDGTDHLAIVVHADGASISLFPISSKINTRKLYIRIDSYAVVDLDANMQRILFPGSRLQSFLFCGERNVVEMPNFDFASHLHKGTIKKIMDAPSKFLNQVKDAIDNSYTLSPRKQALFFKSLDSVVLSIKATTVR